MVPYLVT